MGTTDRYLTLIEVARRELDGDDARVEIGGRDPTAPELVWVPLADGRRLVVVMSEVPAHQAELRSKLQTLVGSFGETLRHEDDRPSTPPPDELRRRRLDLELAALAERAGARAAFVIDVRSPVLWGAAPRDALLPDTAQADELAALSVQHPDLASMSTEELLALGKESDAARDVIPLLDVEPKQRQLLLLAAEATHAARTDGNGLGERWLFREFFQIYRLILVFDGAFSQLKAEGWMVRAQPTIERLVLTLPPVDPPPGKARVVRFEPPSR